MIEEDLSSHILLNYTKLKVLGQGSQGTVCLLENKKTKEKSCLKIILLKDETAQKYSKSELDISTKLKHVNIVQFFESSFDEQRNVAILHMQYCNRGDLNSYIQSVKTLNDEIILDLMAQLLLSLNYLNRNMVMHRDIKLQNVLVHEEKGVTLYKLSDFGYSKQCENNKAHNQTILGTALYMSPEQFKDLPYNMKSDVYALGVLFYFIVEKRFPYHAECYSQQKEIVLKGELTPMSSQVNEQIKEIITNMLNKLPFKRHEASKLLKADILRPYLQKLSQQYAKLGFSDIVKDIQALLE